MMTEGDKKQVKYPIGVQNFEKLRSEGFLYVDKTEVIYRIISSPTYYFLSRPRRFGKSLLLSTLEAYYQGKRHLFKGLALDSLTDEWDAHPILHLDLNTGEYRSRKDLEEVLSNQLADWEQLYGDEHSEDSLPQRFRYVIQNAYEKTGKKVVILIDEYDKPMLKAVNNKPLADEFRSLLKAFYSNLKTKDGCIKIGVMTGVARFSKISVFSDLNNLRDISFLDEFSTLCGVTTEELDKYFATGIQTLATTLKKSPEEIREELRRNYDGYHFSKKSPDIYNPFSLINVFNDCEIGKYWFEWGTPTYLIQLLQKSNLRIADLSPCTIRETSLRTGSLMSGDIIASLYQSGYLTIKGYNPEFQKYTLGYPNREVEEGFIANLIPYYLSKGESDSAFDIEGFVDAVNEGNPDKFMQLIDSLLSGMPYSEHGNPEARFEDVIFAIFTLMGFYVRMEERTSNGRIDLKVETYDYVYIFEFKINSTAEEAIKQIHRKEYWLPYRTSGKEIFLIGASFSSETGRLSSQLIEKV